MVAHRDRLCRFAFELMSWIFQVHDVKLVVLDQKVGAAQQELAEDLLAQEARSSTPPWPVILRTGTGAVVVLDAHSKCETQCHVLQR